MSDVSFSTIADGPIEPSLWPIETLPRQFRTVSDPPQTIENEHLLWVREAFGPGAELMDDPAFGRAFQTFDAAIWAHTAGSALVTIWAALETLIQPGKQQITKRLASSLAALLEPPGPMRNRLFGRAKSLYGSSRGLCSCVSLAGGSAAPVKFRDWSTVVRVVYRQASVAESCRTSRDVAPRKVAHRRDYKLAAASASAEWEMVIEVFAPSEF